MLKSTRMPLILICILILSLLLGQYIPVNIKSFFYAISLSIQTILMVILPFLIFSFLFRSIASFHNSAFSFLIFVMACVCLSNFIYTQLSYSINSLEIITKVQKIPVSKNGLMPYWKLNIPELIPNNMALLAGIICGLIPAMITKLRSLKRSPIKLDDASLSSLNKSFTQASIKLVNASLFFLNRIFIPTVPLFILGFALKLQHDDMLLPLFRDYGFVLITGFLPAIIYLLVMYFIGSNMKLEKFFSSIKNMLSPAITGLTTMSGAAAIPATITASEDNTKDPVVVQSVIPMTANIHLIGDGFFIPTLALAVMASFGMEFPDASTYMLFSLKFVLAKFAVAGVPGGGVFVMLPILKSIFGFNNEMTALVTSIYMISDSINTSINVLGNGAFVMNISKIYRQIQKIFSKKASKI